MDSTGNSTGLSPIMPSPAGGFVDDADVFSWMFMNPELFPARTLLPGMQAPDELSLPSPPVSPFGEIPAVKQENTGLELLDRRSSYEDNDDEDYDSSNDSSGPLSVISSKISADPARTTAAAGGRRSHSRSKGSSSSAAQIAANGSGGEDPRLKRLEKNREIARNCRKRKREKMEALEEEVQKLQEWNRQLEAKLKQMPESDTKEEVRKRELQDIAALVANDSSSSESDIRKKLHQYKEVYSDFGRDRKQAITFHLEQLKTLLLPNQVSKMTLWSLQQDDDFYDEQRNKTTFGGGIWNLLCEELRLTEEQKRGLLAMRGEIRGQRKNVGECLRILKELEKRIGENVTSMGKQMSKVMGATSANQQARFLLWLEQNRSDVQVLNNIWENKVYRRTE